MIVCKCCGKASPKIRATAFDIEWLLQFVCDFYGMPKEAVTSNSLFKRERKIRHVFLLMAHTFSGMTIQQISQYFYMNLTTVEMGIKYGRQYKQDVNLLTKLLDEELLSINEAA